MIARPSAGRLPQKRRPVACSSAATTSGGNPSGYVGSGASATTPMSSQWPVVESLPGPSGCSRPWMTGSRAGATPSIGTIDPSPSRSSVGTCNPPTASATCWRVFASGGSPYASASGSAPAPQASMTTTAARRWSFGRLIPRRIVPVARAGPPSRGPAADPAVRFCDLGIRGRARVGAELRVLQALGREVRVDLRRRNVRVAEHLLQRAQVAAAGEQVGREGVAQRVRAHPPLEAGGARVALDDLVEALARQAAAAAVEDETRLVAQPDERGTAAVEVGARGEDGLAADRHEALLAALAAGAQDPGLEVDVADLERDRLRRAQPARVHELEQRPVAQGRRVRAARGGEQLRDLAAAQDLRQALALARRAEVGGRVVVDRVLAAQVAVERPQARGLALQRRGRDRRAARPPPAP